MKRFFNWLLTFGKSPDTIIEDFDKERQTYSKPERPYSKPYTPNSDYRGRGFWDSVELALFIWGDDD